MRLSVSSLCHHTGVVDFHCPYKFHIFLCNLHTFKEFLLMHCPPLLSVSLMTPLPLPPMNLLHGVIYVVCARTHERTFCTQS